MLRAYFAENGALNKTELSVVRPTLPERTMWLDMHQPSHEEEQLVERLFGINVPTREDMKEIEASSRIYQEDDALFMTITLVLKGDTEMPDSTVMTFILTGRSLITVRYADPSPVRMFASQLERHPRICELPEALLAGLIDAIVDRIADVLEVVGADLDALSREIFAGAARPSGRDFEQMLTRIGRKGDVTSKARESLVSLGRALPFVLQSLRVEARKSTQGQFTTLSRDVTSLSDYASFLNGKINFLLDATLGMINIEQTKIIKIFSVAAVIFLPPTLIASIYGMNFEWMPALDSRFGYPLSLVLMLISAILPYAMFKRRGWL